MNPDIENSTSRARRPAPASKCAPRARPRAFRALPCAGGAALAALLLTAAANTANAAPSRAVPAVDGREHGRAAPAQAERPEKAILLWYDDVDTAIAAASVDYRPVLLLFTSPTCGWCARMKKEMLADPEVLALLAEFSLAEIDVTRDERAAALYQVQGVPVILTLSADGRVRQGASGYLPASEVRDLLAAALNPAFLKTKDAAYNELIGLLDEGKLPEERWPEVMIRLGDARKRKELRDKIVALDPRPLKTLVSLLRDRRLAVRLGALETLQEFSATAHGFDPWLDESSAAANAEAMAKWTDWAEAAGSSTGTVYFALSRSEIDAYVEDLVSGNRERALRAMSMLERAGPQVASTFDDFLKAHPDLNPDAARRIKEVQYALLIPSLPGIDPPTIARRLVCGTLDAKIKSLSTLQAAGMKALPVVREFLDDPEAMVRETAIDVLVAAGGRWSVTPIRDHLKTERDINVIHSAIRGLGKIRSRRSLATLISFLENDDEDLVVAALAGIGRLRSKTAEESIVRRLEDPRWRVRVAALDAIATLRLSSRQENVKKLLSDPDAFVRHQAVKTLAAIGAKDSASRLEEVFLKEDELKGPVVAAFAAMEIPLPDSFARGLEGKRPETLLSVIEALAEHDGGQEPLSVSLMDHPDSDVACAAIRLAAGSSKPHSDIRGKLLRILRSGDSDRILAALEALSGASSRWQYGGSSAILAQMSAIGGPEMLFRAMEESGLDIEDGDMGDLFSAFGEAGGGDAASAPETPAPAPADGGSNAPPAAMDDLFAAFESGAAEGGGSTPKDKAQPEDNPAAILKEIEACLDSATDDRIRYQAAMALAQLGNDKAARYCEAGLDNRTAAERRDIARAFGKKMATNSVPLLRRLLRDQTGFVREAAVETCFTHVAGAEFVDAVFEELMLPDSPLQPHEVYDDRIRSAVQNVRGKRLVGKWARKLLESGDEEGRVNLALLLLGKCWKKTDVELVEPHLHAKSPYRRRAALTALGLNDRDRLEKELEWAVKDESEVVRGLVPQLYSSDYSRRLSYIDATHFSTDYDYDLRYDADEHRLSEKVRKALLLLTEDPSPKVRIESFFTLLSLRQPFDLAKFVETIDSLPDRGGAIERVSSYLSGHYRNLGSSFRILVPYLDAKEQDESSMEQIRKHFGFDEDDLDIEYAMRTDSPGTPEMATFLPETKSGSAPPPRALKLVYFTSAGCSDCARVEEMLPQFADLFPNLEIERHNLRTTRAMKLNEALCERFHVPETIRLVSPALFAGGGFLIKKDISFDRVGVLLARSASVPDEDWMSVGEEELAKAGEAIGSRGAAFSAGVVMLAGLADGVNPCAFATLIFLLSYLQIARRLPREMIWVGTAFTAGVFAAYFAMGLGLVGIVERLSVLGVFGKYFNRVLAAFALVVMVLSFRDGVLCLMGKMEDMTLQLPLFLKERIHGAIRRGTRHTHFVLAAFVVGVVISFLELACTGQVYAPTVFFMIQTGRNTAGALLYLLLYNVAFIIPLVIAFVVAYFGAGTESFARFMRKHAALVKFVTALLFLALFLFFVFGDRLQAWMRP